MVGLLGVDPLILTFDPNFQWDIQVCLKTLPPNSLFLSVENEMPPSFFQVIRTDHPNGGHIFHWKGHE